MNPAGSAETHAPLPITAQSFARGLVILDENQVTTSPITDDPVLRRAYEVALATKASLEFLIIAYDSRLSSSFFASEDELADSRRQVVEKLSEDLARLCDKLADLGVDATHDVTWGHPRAAAMLHKIESSRPDFVLKGGQGEAFALGLVANTDWELARFSPAPIWFVHGSSSPASGIIVAIDQLPQGVDSNSQRATLNYDVFRCAQMLADRFDSKLTMIHAFELPFKLEGYAPALGGVPPCTVDPAVANEDQFRLAARHGAAIESFAQYFDFPLDDVVVKEGPAPAVLSEVADERAVGLIVLGATELNTWERMLDRPTSEPKLSQPSCDVLVVHPGDIKSAAGPVASVAKRHLKERRSDPHGVKAVIVDPSSHFNLPQDVLLDCRFSIQEKRRILTAWERDAYQLSVAEEEGNISAGEVGIGLASVRSALRALTEQEAKEQIWAIRVGDG